MAQTNEMRIFRHTLHNLVNCATPEQVYYALHNEQSPLHPPFLKFLAFSYADWLSGQANIDQKKAQNEWEIAFTTTPPTKNGTYERHDDPQLNGFANTVNRDETKTPESDDSSDLGDVAVTHEVMGNGSATEEENSLTGSEDYDHDKYIMTAKGLRIKMKAKDPLKHFAPIFDSMDFPSRKRGSGIDATDMEQMKAISQDSYAKLSPQKLNLVKSKLPLLADIRAPPQREELICRKLELCCVTFDFNSNSIAEIKAIEKKKTILTEILEYVARFNWYSENVLRQCFVTIAANLFRTLPAPSRSEDETEPYEDKAWPHLQLVYDLTLRLVICTDVDKKIMKKYLEGPFVAHVIELFASEDHREREYLKTILHRIYGRFMPLRGVIRSAISNCCFRTVYTSSRSENGIAEFLEIFCSIIHGFSIPVKEEHKEFMRNVLVPLHKCRKLEKFHEQLVACCVQFVFKDPSVAPVILGGLLRFWPRQSPIKEEMFITEVINIISALLNHKNGFVWESYRVILMRVVDKVIECMTCGHHQVAERAVALWMEESMEMLSDQDRDAIWTRLAAAFEKNKEHWNVNLRQTNEEVLEHLRSRDSEEWHRYEMRVLKRYSTDNEIDESFDAMVDPIIESSQEKILREVGKRKEREDKWALLRIRARETKLEMNMDDIDGKEKEMVQEHVDGDRDGSHKDDSLVVPSRVRIPPRSESDVDSSDYDDDDREDHEDDNDEEATEEGGGGGGGGTRSPTKRRVRTSSNGRSASPSGRSPSPSRRTGSEQRDFKDDERPRRKSPEITPSRSPQLQPNEDTLGSPTKRGPRTRTNHSNARGGGGGGGGPRSPGRSNRTRPKNGRSSPQTKSRPSRPVTKRNARPRKGSGNHAE